MLLFSTIREAQTLNTSQNALRATPSSGSMTIKRLVVLRYIELDRESRMTALSLFRDWFPSAAVLVGGAFVLVKFVLSELGRREKETIAIEGDLEISGVPLDEQQCFVTVQARWRNPSPRVCRIDTKASRIDVYVIPGDLKFGAVVPKRDLGDPVVRLHPYEDMDSFFLEPNTASLLPSHYVLERGKLYLIRWKLYRYVGTRAPFAYTKERVCDLRTSAVGKTETKEAPNTVAQTDGYAAA